MANGVISEDVSYFINTYPLNPPGQNRQGITIGVPSTDSSVPSFYIKKLTFNENIFSPITSGQIVMTFTGFFQTNIYDFIKEGDAFRLFEVFGNESSVAARFTGYIASIRFRYKFGNNAGTEVYINFYNLLGQWAIQSTLTSFNQQIGQGFTNVTSNEIPFGQALANLVQGSLFQLLINQNVLVPNTSYNNVALPIQLGPNALQLNQNVWAYIATNSTKQETIEKILFPYQNVYYQQPNGIITVDLLRTIPNSIPEFNFFYQNPSSGSTTFSSQNFIDIEVTHAAAMVHNRVISTLINTPFFPPDQGIPENYVASILNPFQRPQDLYNSGFFQLLDVEQDTLSEDMITDPTLLSYMNVGIAATGYPVTLISGQPTIAGTFASRKLAKENFQETGVFITQPRKMAPYAGATPLGTMVNVNLPTFLDATTNQLYCYGTVTNYESGTGTTFTLQLCKQGCFTSYWSNS